MAGLGGVGFGGQMGYVTAMLRAGAGGDLPGYVHNLRRSRPCPVTPIVGQDGWVDGSQFQLPGQDHRVAADAYGFVEHQSWSVHQL